MNDMEKAIAYLVTLLDMGAEWPEATHKASYKFGVSCAALEAAYDEDQENV